MTGVYRLDRALIRVSGPDAVAFLDNVLTQNVTRLADAGVLYAALLTPQGKVLADMLLWHDASDGVLIETSPLRAGDLQRRLSMYQLRAQVRIEDITGQFPVLWSAERFPGAAGDPRLSGLGWREVAALPPEQVDFPAGAVAFEAHRLALGVPDLARDAEPDEVFALEALLEELNGVDFQKGCFVGQENVSRMKRRATTRKKFCPIEFAGEAPPFGATLIANAAEVGVVRTGLAGRAMALVRLDRAAGQTLRTDGREVRLSPPSWLILPRAGGAAGAPD